MKGPRRVGVCVRNTRGAEVEKNLPSLSFHLFCLIFSLSYKFHLLFSELLKSRSLLLLIILHDTKSEMQR